MISFSELGARLSREWDQMPDTNELMSGIIFPLYGTWEKMEGLILTQRSAHLKSHPGQISFPGGVFETKDKNLLATALREWEEEMGVSRELVHVLGKMDGLPTRTGFHITPFLGKYEGNFEFRQNPEEVEKVFQLPLSELWESPFYKVTFSFKAETRTSYYFDLADGLLWGATCELILRFLKEYLGFQREPILAKPNVQVPPFFDPKKISF